MSTKENKEVRHLISVLSNLLSVIGLPEVETERLYMVTDPRCAEAIIDARTALTYAVTHTSTCASNYEIYPLPACDCGSISLEIDKNDICILCKKDNNSLITIYDKKICVNCIDALNCLV